MNTKLKTVLAMILSFGVSAWLMQFVEFKNTPVLNTEKMALQMQRIQSDVTTRVGQFSSVLTQLPNSIIHSQALPTPVSIANSSTGSSSSIGFSTLPTAVPQPVTPTFAPFAPTSPPARPTSAPTNKPLPSSTPKPTAKPSPTTEPTPALPAGYVRPGKTIDEVFTIAGQKSCVPANLLKAFVAQEAPGVLTWNEKAVQLYNAYDWWHRVTEKKQVCSGYGWYPETGLIPDDSNFAGEKCKEGINGDTVSKSLGAGQMLEYYWNKTFKQKTEATLGIDRADRRVVLDALVGFGINIKEGTKNPGGCDNWEFKYIIKAACVNTGGGSAYSYYYGIICRNYNKFANQNNNCDNVASMIVPDSFCQLK